MLAWPIVVARASQAVIGFCDALMTARLGEDQLAAVTTGALNVFYTGILPFGVVFIVQSFASQLKSKGDMAAARRYAWYGLLLAAVTGALTAAAIPLLGPILGLFGFAPSVRDLMADYMGIRLLAMTALIGVEVIGNWYGGLGNTRLHMAAGLIAMVLNVFLNWVLIYGNLGAPAMGTDGAALASTIASWLAFAFLALVFWKRWWLDDDGGERLKLRMSEFRRMIRFGLPNGFNWFLEFSAFILFMNIVVADLGTTVLAAMMVVFNINSVSFMPSFGISSSGAILAGQAIGADRHDHVPIILRRTIGVAMIWQGTIGLLYIAIPAILMSWFAPHDAVGTRELVEIGAVMLAISAAWQLFDAVGMAVSETLRAAGDTAWCLYARLVIAWVIFVPGSTLHIMVFGGGHISAMIWLVVYLAVLAVAFVWRFRSGRWRDIDLTGVEAVMIGDRA